ncbi:MAG: FAD-dependent oxidoreductase [Verrucomicrobia bacterium]|nr:FAD-dependent oxidoreductase [Verrucomicrobiota bacterium]
MTSFDSIKEQRVAVIGAGIAGLTTAYRLYKAGIPVEVFEARERPGGRILTYYEGFSYEELGGKFIDDGSEGTELKALIHELGLQVETYIIPFEKIYYSQGKAHNYYDLFLEAPPPTDENYHLIKRQSKSERLLTALRRFFSDHQELLRVLELRIANYEGSATEDLDDYYLPLFWDFYKRSYQIAHGEEKAEYKIEYVQGGNTRLVQVISHHLTVHYNTPLTKIFKARRKIGLECGGKVQFFDKVVLAVPCTILRTVEIEPHLFPDDQLQAVRTLQYGTAAKIIFPIEIEDTNIPSFAYGSDFVVWFNRDYTLMTLYAGGNAGKFEPSRAPLERFLQEIQVLYPQVKIKGNPPMISWWNEQYSRGSFSNFGPHQYDLFNEKTFIDDITLKKVFRPVEDKIYFAGEHAALKYHGTMEGAVSSGNQAARLVLHAIQKNC